MSRRRRRPLRSRLRAALRWLLAFLFTNVGVVLLVLGYTIAGAFVFQAIEGAEEVERALGMARARNATALYLWTNVALPLNTLNETNFKHSVNMELLRYQQKIVLARRRGWEGGSGSSGDLRRWNFSSAFLYCLTVITTIGYGHLSPRTSWGKLTTILYALLGMPLFLLYLSNVGELFASWFKWLYALVCLCRGCPGFHRRRVAKLRAQITEELGELSELESIEALGREASRNVLESFSGHGPSAFQNHSRSRKLNYLRTLSEPQSRQYVHHERAYTERRSDRRPYGENDLRCGDDYVTHNRRLNRGQSLPAGYGCDEGSSTTATSDFTYVTFDAQTITVPISVCVSILVGYVIFGSMIFGMWEKWDQLDGAYFCFISLSSIGFGDFVPGERVYTPTIETSFIVCSLYLMLGMALVAMCFNLMQEQVIHYYAGAKRALRRTCRCLR